MRFIDNVWTQEQCEGHLCKMEGALGTVTSSATYFTYHKYLPRHRYHHVSIGNWRLRLHSFLMVVQLVHQRKEWNLNSSQSVPSCLPTFQNKIQPFWEVGKWRLALPVWQMVTVVLRELCGGWGTRSRPASVSTSLSFGVEKSPQCAVCILNSGKAERSLSGIGLCRSHYLYG